MRKRSLFLPNPTGALLWLWFNVLADGMLPLWGKHLREVIPPQKNIPLLFLTLKAIEGKKLVNNMTANENQITL